MFSLLLFCPSGDRDFLIARLWEEGTAGIVEQPEYLQAFFEESDRAEDLQRAFGRYAPRLQAASDTDWTAETEASFPPLLIGERFFLAPPWSDAATPAGRVRLEINPGMACGTGWHPCTQMCLEALERHLKPGQSVLDVGAGSGILSVAAALLGAGRVVACDVDPEAVAVARGTATAIFVGSVDAIRSSSFDLVVANISAEAIAALLPELERVRRVEGRLILSGFTKSGSPASPLERLEREGWTCLVC